MDVLLKYADPRERDDICYAGVTFLKVAMERAGKPRFTQSNLFFRSSFFFLFFADILRDLGMMRWRRAGLNLAHFKLLASRGSHFLAPPSPPRSIESPFSFISLFHTTGTWPIARNLLEVSVRQRSTTASPRKVV